MKKTIAVLLVLLLGMTALLAGCGSGGGSQEESDPSVLKVGYIFPGSIIDGDVSQALYAGAVEAEAAMSGQVETVYLENIDASDASAQEDAAKDLIGQGCQVIVECAPGTSDAMESLANSGAYDNIIFLDFGGSKTNGANLSNWYGSMEQGRYMAGIAAASALKRGGTIGYVAPEPSSEVVIGLDAFALGAQSVNDKVKIEVIYTGGQSPEAIKRGAQLLIDDGAKVVACHSGSAAVQEAVSEAGNVYAIGAVYPVNNCGDLYLTSPYWYAAAFLTPTFESIMKGEFNGGTYYGSVASGLVAIDETGPAVSEDTWAKIQDTKARMEADVLAIFSGKIEYADGDLLCDEGQVLEGDEIYSINREIKGITVYTPNAE